MKKYLLIFFSVLFLAFGNFCFAQLKSTSDMRTNTEKFGENSGYAIVDAKGLPSQLAEIIRVFLGMLGVIFVILIIVSGWNWFTAGGNTAQIKTAKDRLINATIGLIIIFSAYGITYFVFKSADSVGGIQGGGANTATVP